VKVHFATCLFILREPRLQIIELPWSALHPMTAAHLLSESTSCRKRPSLPLAGSIPTEFAKLTNLQKLRLGSNKLSGTPPFAYVAWFGGTSLPLAESGIPLALAGLIPTELGQLINLTSLDLSGNQLIGTPLLFMLPVW
jgi:Leucine-rich repeat (LRR) protein